MMSTKKRLLINKNVDCMWFSDVAKLYLNALL